MNAFIKIISNGLIDIQHNNFVNKANDGDFSILINANNENELRGKVIFHLSKMKIHDANKKYDFNNTELTPSTRMKLNIYEAINLFSNGHDLNYDVGNETQLQIQIVLD